MSNRVLRFEMQVIDPERAVAFYTKTFGWEFVKYPGPHEYWFITTGSGDTPGIDGGMMASPDGVSRTYNSIEVPSVDEYVEKVLAHGGGVAVPKMTIPGIGYLAYCTDPEGRLFGVS